MPHLTSSVQDYCQEPNWSPHLRTRPRGTCSSAFIGGGLFFLHSSFLRDVPFDPFLPYLFHGEEVCECVGARWSGCEPSV